LLFSFSSLFSDFSSFLPEKIENGDLKLKFSFSAIAGVINPVNKNIINKKVIVMMNYLSPDEVEELIIRSNKARGYNEDALEEADDSSSYFVINPNNTLLYHWCNFVQLSFIMWIFLMPYHVSVYQDMKYEQIEFLLLFDIIFIIDRFIDLLVGFYRPNGDLEERLIPVLK
jgi:hypothetical protein